MANIIFTNKCNIQCPFCFASENNAKDQKKEEEHFDIYKSWDLTTFLSKKYFRFCGGEPTINPEVLKTFDVLLKSDYAIFFMSNGIWSQKFREYVEKMPYDYKLRVSYLFNILEPKFYKNGEFDQIEKTLSSINPIRTTLGFTIYKEDFEFQYLIDLARKYKISNIRWSVAAPNISNSIHTLENSFREIAKKVVKLYEVCKAAEIRVNQDCNYIQPCYYEKDDLLKLMIGNRELAFGCGSNSPVDIGPDGMSWRCYGLYSILRSEYKNFKNEIELEGYFTRRVKLLNNIYAYEECKSCDFWLKGCGGGCYVFRIKKALQQKPDLILFPIDDDNEILKCKPYLLNSNRIQNSKTDPVIYTKEKIFVNEDENTLSFLSTIDGKLSVADLIAKWKDNYSSSENAKKDVIAKCRELFEKNMIQINYDYDAKPENRP